MRYTFKSKEIKDCYQCPLKYVDGFKWHCCLTGFRVLKPMDVGSVNEHVNTEKLESCPLKEVPEVDTELISHIVPDYKRGIRKGLESYEAIEEEANKNFNKILKFFDEE